jgi:hypothetical protein
MSYPAGNPHEQLDEMFAPHGADELGHIALAEAADAELPIDDEQLRAEGAFSDHLTHISAHVEEAAQEAERITRGAAQLIEVFKVKPEFFEEAKRSTIFASLALSAAKTQEALEAGTGDRRELERKQGFIANTTFLLTCKHADGFPELSAQHEHEDRGGQDSIAKSKMDKFEQPELTRSLREHIAREGILDELKTRIGAGGEDPEYHVLSIGSTPAFHFDREANGITYEEAREWDKGLEERTRQFGQSIPGGELAARAAGFAVSFEEDTDHHHVYIPAPAAELVMAEERGIVPNQYMIDTRTAERTVSTIKHEYVHTQDPLNVGGEFGKSLEERRAEYFSGDKSEYYEVKSFFRQLQLLRGKYVGDIYEEALESRHTDDPVDTYELVGKYFGMEAVAEIAASQPDAYVRFASSSFTKDMLNSLGGYAAIVERMAKDDSVDVDEARTRTARVINNFRADKIKDGQFNPDQEEFLGTYFGPVLRGLDMHMADIPYEPPVPK